MRTIKDIIESNNISSEYAAKLVEAEHIFDQIYETCGRTFIPGDGSYLFEGGAYEYCVKMYPKQEMLYHLAKNSNSVLEIGTYMGHSLLIMLLANPQLHITSVDLVDTYARPSTDLLKTYFPKSKIEFIHGDSLDVLPSLSKKFDLFHIDGHHLEEHIRKEVQECERLSDQKIVRIVFDDIHCCQKLLDEIVASRKVLKHITPGCIWTNAYVEFCL